MTAAERMRRLRARRKKAGLKEVLSWVPTASAASASAPRVFSDHRIAEARSLAMHTLIARRIMKDPGLLSKPQENLARWRAKWDRVPGWAQEWQQILQLPYEEIAALISEPSEEAARLRQSSPFAGVLTSKERSRIYDVFKG